MLGSVLDRTRLDDASLRTGLLKVDVEAAWLVAGGALTVVLPRRVACATCEGGGCSRCGNSGAFRLASDAPHAPLRIELSSSEAAPRRVRVPIADAAIDVLVLELQASDAPSSFARYAPRATAMVSSAPALHARPEGIIATVLALTALVVAIVLALLARG